jgi:hypothetical protein
MNSRKTAAVIPRGGGDVHCEEKFAMSTHNKNQNTKEEGEKGVAVCFFLLPLFF